MNSEQSEVCGHAFPVQAVVTDHWNGDYLYESTNRPDDGATIHAITTFARGGNENSILQALPSWVHGSRRQNKEATKVFFFRPSLINPNIYIISILILI